MKKLLTIQFVPSWVLLHREEKPLPVAYLQQELAKSCSFVVNGRSFANLELLFDEDKFDEKALNDKIFKILKSRYKDDDVKLICATDTSIYLESDDEVDIFGNYRPQTTTTVSNDSPKQKTETVLDEIDKLAGAAEFKALAREIAMIAPEVRKHKTHDIFTSQSYLFSIGDGCGTTTCLQLLAKLLAEVDIKKVNLNRALIEHKLPPVRDSMEPFEEVIGTLKNGNPNELRILCLDISEWLNATENRCFKQCLRMLEKQSDCFVVVFRIPFVDKDVLERIKLSISDLLYVRDVSFPPLSQEELQQGAKAELSNYGFTVQDSAWSHFDKRIALEKSDGKFYGMSTVKKVVRELIYKKQLFNAQNGEESSIIFDADMSQISSGDFSDYVTGEEQLKALIGNEKIRQRLDEILAQIDLAMKEGGARPCIHMRFVGNPGTGKTTVARILGRILKERGVLSVGNFFEYAGRDFCGRYVGETAPKTAAMCRDAYGSVLFIDEAYSLYKEGSNVDYGREAIDTLIAEMENHRNDFVVIMAGYTDEMENLMKANIGLQSRMPYKLEFPSFSRGELYRIYESMLKSKFKYSEDLLDAVRDYFNNLPEDFVCSKTFSNARYVRNLFERTWAKASMRCQLEKCAEIVLTRDDFVRASNDAEFANNATKHRRIGF